MPTSAVNTGLNKLTYHCKKVLDSAKVWEQMTLYLSSVDLTKKSQLGNVLDGMMQYTEQASCTLRKLTPRPTNNHFGQLLHHHGISADGPFCNALRGFHCHRSYCIKTCADTSPASLSSPYQPSRGFGEGDGTSPWAWNVPYSGIVRLMERAKNGWESASCLAVVCTSFVHLHRNNAADQQWCFGPGQPISDYPSQLLSL